MSERRQRTTKPEQVGQLLPEAARALGLEGELRLARRSTAFNALLATLAPTLKGHCVLVSIERGEMIIDAETSAAAQELHLRGREITKAFADLPEGERTHGLHVRVVPPKENRL
jgi:hypothetical protein